jgi:hypothetical protein
MASILPRRSDSARTSLSPVSDMGKSVISKEVEEPPGAGLDRAPINRQAPAGNQRKH